MQENNGSGLMASGDARPARRSVLTGGAVLGLAAATTLVTRPSPAPAATAMDNWRFCGNCFGLFQTISEDGNVCPRTRGAHQQIGWTFRLNYNLSSAGTGENGSTQANWRLCGKCAGLFWAPSTAQRCPASGAHN